MNSGLSDSEQIGCQGLFLQRNRALRNEWLRIDCKGNNFKEFEESAASQNITVIA